MASMTTFTATSLTKQLVDTWVSEGLVGRREKVDTERLEFLLNNPDVPKKDKALLTAWKKLIKEGCWADIVYVLGKNVKDSDEALGRLNAKGGVGLQAFPRDIRNALAQRLYWDIDMVSAHPTLTRELSRRHNLSTTYQDELINNRNDKISELMDLKECSKELAKIYITAIYFGEEISCASLPDFYKQLYKEVDTARKVITQDKDWTEALRFLTGKKKNRLGSAFSYILQTIERGCLLAMEKSAKRNGRNFDTYIHDGGLIRRREGEEEFPEALLRTMEADILNETGFVVSLVSKPMETSYTFAIKENTAYLEMKDKFENEEGIFSVKNPCCFGRVYNGKLQMLDGGDIGKNYETWKVDGEAFLPMWRKDPERREYEEFVFLPGKEAPPHQFNLFTGWDFKPEQNDALVERWVYLVSLLANHDEECKNWLLDYFAHIFQRPWDKPGVAVVLKGKKGSGKDTPCDALGRLLGVMFYNTGTPEKSIFSAFNGMMMKNLLVKLEEATYSNGKANEDVLKYYITTPTLDVQQKNKDQFNVPNFSRWIFTTNWNVSVVTSDDERRYAFFQTSDERVGDRAFWDETYTILHSNGFNEALLHYLLNRDISKFKPRNYPETQYARDVKQSFIPIVAQYFREWIDKHDIPDEDIPDFQQQAVKMMEKINDMGKFKINHISLYNAIKEDFGDVVVRTTPHNKVHYGFNVVRMREHLENKGWWARV